DVYDLTVLSRNGMVGELELRYRPFDRPGTTRFGVWATSAFTGGYADAVALANANPSLTANDTIASTRQTRTKYGLYFSIDQEITDSIGAFARFSWNDGRSEILAFTDIDGSISGGLSIKGDLWGRPGDTVGIGGAITSISASHSAYLAAGGLGAAG